MAKNKMTRRTKAIAFRLDEQAVDAITQDAEQMGITVQEYFLSQIQPQSRLHAILEEQQMRMLNRSKNIATIRDKMAEEAKQMREALGVSKEDFDLALLQSIKMLTGSEEEEKK